MSSGEKRTIGSGERGKPGAGKNRTIVRRRRTKNEKLPPPLERVMGQDERRQVTRMME